MLTMPIGHCRMPRPASQTSRARRMEKIAPTSASVARRTGHGILTVAAATPANGGDNIGGHVLLPVVLIAIGVLILIEGGAFGL
jgi:cadmium resistance protein CadD (predicted permease)